MRREGGRTLPLGDVLLDSMIVIEAVRTGSWKAISGRRRMITVETCADELLRGDPTVPGYVPVKAADLARAVVEPLPPLAAAQFRLEYPAADGLDPGERDLLALGMAHSGAFHICCCDKAAVRAAHSLGWIDRVVSLESLTREVGVRPNPALRTQYTENRLSEWRTKLMLGVGI